MSGGQNGHRKKTSEKLAAEYNVDEKTIRRDAKFAEAVDRPTTITPLALQSPWSMQNT
jgi:hypothetical protein